MKVVLAEKPSVGRDIASALGAKSRRDGYYEGQGYQVTWSFGHIFTLKEPAEYDPNYKSWSLNTLPITPEIFELKLIDDAGIRKQFSVIKRLLQNADEVVCATDAGREGELIFRYIFHMAGCENRSFQRLWLSSLTDEAIREGFNNLQSGSKYDNLYAAAKCRSQADWIVGLNGTRNFTVRYGGREKILWSVGRVQTPVLAMIVKRDDEIRNFRPEPFWELMSRYRDVVFKFKGKRFNKEEDAETLQEKVSGHPFVIENIKGKKQNQNPPLLYDLTSLQRDMNRLYGLSASKTLELAQLLYENKLLTYPRTDSQYLSQDMKGKVISVLRKLKAEKQQEIDPLDLDNLSFNMRIINDKKVTDHHAIIPTGKVPRDLPSPSANIFGAVLTRLIAAFYPKCIKEITTVGAVSNSVSFEARGTRIIDPGWTVLYPTQNNKDSSEEQQLPKFVKGEQGDHEPLIKSGKTKPSSNYNESSLLGAMETAGRMVEDEQSKDALKDRGIGTPATRAEIIETLLRRGYIVREKKKIIATDLGRYLIALVKDPNLKSPELTGGWESRLKAMEKGEFPAEQFMNRVIEFTNELIQTSNVSAINNNSLGNCPRCNNSVIKGRRGYGCSKWREGCEFVIWSEYRGVELSVRQIQALLQHKVLLGPIKDKDGVESVLYLSDDGHLMDIGVPKKDRQKPIRQESWKAEKNTAPASQPATKDLPLIGDCPLCSQKIVEHENAYSCSNSKQQCRFIVPKTFAGKKIGLRSVKTLLKRGETSQLKGFKSKAGKSFEARLKLQNGKIELCSDQ
ncbi:TPA: type IA DNA topoisomerase [Candidatus Poribacteria bacterium]|nr:type IA DNA topoisomerase [Candidatus Poribacteria bacterium]